MDTTLVELTLTALFIPFFCSCYDCIVNPKRKPEDRMVLVFKIFSKILFLYICFVLSYSFVSLFVSQDRYIMILWYELTLTPFYAYSLVKELLIVFLREFPKLVERLVEYCSRRLKEIMEYVQPIILNALNHAYENVTQAIAKVQSLFN